MSDVLEILSKHHQQWITYARAFVGDLANDIVQDFYLKVYQNDRFIVDGKVNKYYCYLAIKSISIDYHRTKIQSIEFQDREQKNDNHEDEYIAMDILFEKIHQEMETWHDYDKKLFEIYMYSGLSLRDISNGVKPKKIDRIRLFSEKRFITEASLLRGSSVSVSSMFTTIKGCKDKLKEKLGEDFEDYFNSQYELIKR